MEECVRNILQWWFLLSTKAISWVILLHGVCSGATSSANVRVGLRKKHWKSWRHHIAVVTSTHTSPGEATKCDNFLNMWQLDQSDSTENDVIWLAVRIFSDPAACSAAFGLPTQTLALPMSVPILKAMGAKAWHVPFLWLPASTLLSCHIPTLSWNGRFFPIMLSQRCAGRIWRDSA